MRTILPALMLWFLAAPDSFALTEIESMTRERARELGVVIRSVASGENQVRVLLEFPKQGELKNFSYVELDMTDGKAPLVSALLMTASPKAGQIETSFTTTPGRLKDCTLRILVHNAPRTNIGFDFKVSDFIEPLTEKSSDKTTSAVEKFAGPVPYETASQIIAMPACRLTVQSSAPCWTSFKKPDGTEVYVGSPRAASEVIRFLHTLEKGKTYEFPEAFLKYQKTAPKPKD